LKLLKVEHIMSLFVDILIKSYESKQIDVAIQVIKLFTFFSDD
jgi:hypothetical protein